MAYLDEMNVKANEQDTVGTDYDLRDKDLNAATAKTSVASTDGVVLKGTDGSYHTIDRSSFTEAVRSVIGGILNNMASKGTAVKGVSVIDNSNDFGLTTPSDLASVLGVDKVDVTYIKTWNVQAGFSDFVLPQNFEYGIVVCIRRGSYSGWIAWQSAGDIYGTLTTNDNLPSTSSQWLKLSN